VTGNKTVSAMSGTTADSAGPVSRRVLLVAPVPPPYGGVALQAGLLERMLRRDGVAADLLAHNHPFSARWRFLERVPALRTFLRAGLFYVRFWRQARNKDVVHILASSWLNFLLVVCPAILIGRLQGKRVILNYRGGDADQFLQWCGWLTRPFFRMADITTAPSGFLAHVIQQRIGVPVSIVPNIVNFSSFQYRERLSFGPKMVVTRHLEEAYDVQTVLRAFRQIQLNYPQASLWIAGTGSQETRLRDLAAIWNLSNVRFLGYVDHSVLPGIYDQCDILLNASRVDNFPGSLMEASACGLVVVSTKAGGIGFVYEDGKNALLVDVGDWKALAAAAQRVLEDQRLARQLAAAGAERCRQCEWQNVRRALYAVYGVTLPEGHLEAVSPRPDIAGIAGALTD
jgi:glycosyltransferase involved in cell wall biosynthesis